MSNHPQKSGSLCSGMSGSLCSGIGGSLYSGIGGSLYPGILSFAIAKEIPNPFNWQVEKYKLPDTANLTLFATTTIAMWDIMQTLFNLSEINLELNKDEKASS